MKSVVALLIALGLTGGLHSSQAQSGPDLPVGTSDQVVYDNDDHRDVYTDEYLLALSHLGEIDLDAVITTYAPNEEAYHEFVAGRRAIVEKARRSGLQNLPRVYAGTHRRLVKPESGRIEDTAPLDLSASRVIVQRAQRASPEKPLIVVTGGQLTTVANAYLRDPSIADRVVVSGIFGVQEPGYNAGLDPWAWKIVLARFRVLAIPVGPPGDQGAVYSKPPRVPKERIRDELPQSRPFFEWMHEKHHPTNELPAGHDYDGQAAIPLTQPGYITDVQRWSVQGLDAQGELILKRNSDGPVYEARGANQSTATAEFWRVMGAAAQTTD